MLYGVARYHKNADGSLDEESALLLEDTVTTNATRAVIDATVMDGEDEPWAYRAVSFETTGIPLHKV